MRPQSPAAPFRSTPPKPIDQDSPNMRREKTEAESIGKTIYWWAVAWGDCDFPVHNLGNVSIQRSLDLLLHKFRGSALVVAAHALAPFPFLLSALLPIVPIIGFL
ncbi:hypothetical protein NL676_013558 [Syzygium grande]|nr:hypothetical protein NL676_013558 [Syzygium grande]